MNSVVLIESGFNRLHFLWNFPISSIFQVFFKYFSSIFQVFFKYFSNIFQVFYYHIKPENVCCLRKTDAKKQHHNRKNTEEARSNRASI
jgi:hypothetical protein